MSRAASHLTNVQPPKNEKVSTRTGFEVTRLLTAAASSQPLAACCELPLNCVKSVNYSVRSLSEPERECGKKEQRESWMATDLRWSNKLKGRFEWKEQGYRKAIMRKCKVMDFFSRPKMMTMMIIRRSPASPFFRGSRCQINGTVNVTALIASPLINDNKFLFTSLHHPTSCCLQRNWGGGGLCRHFVLIFPISPPTHRSKQQLQLLTLYVSVAPCRKGLKIFYCIPTQKFHSSQHLRSFMHRRFARWSIELFTFQAKFLFNFIELLISTSNRLERVSLKTLITRQRTFKSRWPKLKIPPN